MSRENSQFLHFTACFAPSALATLGLVKDRQPTRVGNTVQRVLQRIDPDQRMNGFKVWTFWDDEVGEVLAKHAQPSGFRAGVLSVSVDSATWMQELHFLKEGLRERLNRRLGDDLIRDIYFVTGTDRSNEQRPAPGRQKTEARPAAARPLPMPNIRDKEISALFKRIAKAHAKKDQRK